ncbi:hypothetical protein PPL_02506 [Heterostelium album PN500]|uniref:RelA/SpoT domain-containing protein n=1 Tax=Heterostelium pallidum (strain ATCC 26659 / Pp 5 / PN500) TaxID=670386 RepID=D3B297_HETP5|nr:hypothetical protein PPL_02506 [Heterostelium album PN500]EFA84472.1 hypothetical protein PPL_02506 [Heterostelium album PN500]|eukprot:XP_020436586.1 hypothetical protein PPL_02506 [Heterostelium album PN500]
MDINKDNNKNILKTKDNYNYNLYKTSFLFILFLSIFIISVSNINSYKDNLIVYSAPLYLKFKSKLNANHGHFVKINKNNNNNSKNNSNSNSVINKYKLQRDYHYNYNHYQQIKDININNNNSNNNNNNNSVYKFVYLNEDCVNINNIKQDEEVVKEIDKNINFDEFKSIIRKCVDFAQLVAATREQRQQYIEDFKRLLATIDYGYGDANVTIHAIEGRPKHFYSIYNKMHNKNLTFREIHDKYAARIITDTELNCYRLRAGIMRHLEVTEHYDDFIESPKPNGYRSLHMDVYGVDNEIIEIQIRTMQMHQFSEGNYCEYKGECG